MGLILAFKAFRGSKLFYETSIAVNFTKTVKNCLFWPTSDPGFDPIFGLILGGPQGSKRPKIFFEKIFSKEKN